MASRLESRFSSKPVRNLSFASNSGVSAGTDDTRSDDVVSVAPSTFTATYRTSGSSDVFTTSAHISRSNMSPNRKKPIAGSKPGSHRGGAGATAGVLSENVSCYQSMLKSIHSLGAMKLTLQRLVSACAKEDGKLEVGISEAQDVRASILRLLAHQKEQLLELSVITNAITSASPALQRRLSQTGGGCSRFSSKSYRNNNNISASPTDKYTDPMMSPSSGKRSPAGSTESLGSGSPSPLLDALSGKEFTAIFKHTALLEQVAEGLDVKIVSAASHRDAIRHAVFKGTFMLSLIDRALDDEVTVFCEAFPAGSKELPESIIGRQRGAASLSTSSKADTPSDKFILVNAAPLFPGLNLDHFQDVADEVDSKAVAASLLFDSMHRDSEVANTKLKDSQDALQRCIRRGLVMARTKEMESRRLVTLLAGEEAELTERRQQLRNQLRDIQRRIEGLGNNINLRTALWNSHNRRGLETKEITSPTSAKYLEVSNTSHGTAVRSLSPLQKRNTAIVESRSSSPKPSWNHSTKASPNRSVSPNQRLKSPPSASPSKTGAFDEVDWHMKNELSQLKALAAEIIGRIAEIDDAIKASHANKRGYQLDLKSSALRLRTCQAIQDELGNRDVPL